MKLKSFLWLLLLWLGFSPLVFADFINFNSVYEFDIWERTQVWNYSYKFDQYWNVSTDDWTLAWNVAFIQWNNWPDYIYAYGWIDWKLYWYAHNTATQYTQEWYLQGFVSNFSVWDNIIWCFEGSYSLSTDDLLSEIGNIQKVYFTVPWWNPLYLNTNVRLWFYDWDHYYCTAFNLSDWWPAWLTWSLWFDWLNFEQLYSFDWSPSPLWSNTPSPVITDPVCPTVWQVKANYDLVPDICYSWFPSNYTSDSVYIAWTWLSIKDVYELYSWWMSYQWWYDTYYEYYNHINDHLDIFEWHKELMGAFLSRQIFSRWKSSNEILNYCHLILDWLQDSMSCCVAQCTLPWLQITDWYREDILENLIWGDYYYVKTQSWFDTWTFSDVYSWFYWLFSRWTVSPWNNWILPWFIVIWFLGIVLLYFLRR